MLLGRTANGLYWMNRYIERAENMARLVDAGLRMALTRTQSAEEEWKSVLLSAGADNAYAQKHSSYTAATVSDFLIRDASNPSSSMSSIETARFNARMVRTALTRETWESINEAWMSLKRMLAGPIDERDLPKVLDAIKRETALIRGSFYGTMLRNEIFDFSQIGTYVERADNTARILDVKYYVLLPSVSWVGSTLDNYQWESILRSVSAHRSYRWVYEADYRPTNIADYLILNRPHAALADLLLPLPRRASEIPRAGLRPAAALPQDRRGDAGQAQGRLDQGDLRLRPARIPDRASSATIIAWATRSPRTIASTDADGDQCG